MTETPVSIVMAAFNSTAYLREAITSLQNQTMNVFELIIIDDGSTDTTSEIIKEAVRNDPRIQYLRNDKNQGLAASLNLGMERARGRYIARMDADDVAAPDRLEQQVAFFEEDPGLALLGSNVLLTDDGGTEIEKTCLPEDDWTIRCTCLFQNPFAHPSVMMRAAPFREGGLRYDPTYETTQDWELWTRLLSYGKARNLPSPLVRMRLHGSSVSARRRAIQVENSLRVQRKYVEEFLGGRFWDENAFTLINNRFLGDLNAADPGGHDLIDACHRALDLLKNVTDRYPRKQNTGFVNFVVLRCVRMGLLPPLRQGFAGLAARLMVRYPAETGSAAIDLFRLLLTRLTSPVRKNGYAKKRAGDETIALGAGGDERNVRAAYDILEVEKTFSDVIARQETSSQAGSLGRSECSRQGSRITLVISSLECGGAERVASLLSTYWSELGWTITVVTFSHPDKKPFHSLYKDTQYLPLDIALPSPNQIAGILNVFHGIVALRQALKQTEPDVVLSFGDTTNVRVLLAGIGLKKPIVVSERSDPAFAPIRRPWSFLRRLTYVFANRIVVQSRGAKNYFSSYPEEKLAIIPNPIPASANNTPLKNDPLRKPTVVSIGRLSEEKRFDLLLKAFAGLWGRHPDWNLKIFGEGPLRQELEATAQSLGLDPKTTFLGQTDRPQEALRQADLYVLSSRFEGFPNALCEAMAAGLPVIATDCPSGPREIIHDGIDGLLVSNGDVRALTDAMDKLVSDKALRHRLGSEATHITDRFPMEKIAAMWEEVFREAIRMNSPSPTRRK